MINICKAVYRKNRAIVKRAYPWSFIISRISGGVFGCLFPILLYYLVFNKQVSEGFYSSSNQIDYITYIVFGEILAILSFSTLMNVGRCLIGEIREGTLDTFLLSPASRIGYYIGAYIEQLGRSTIEALSVLFIGLILGARFPIQSLPFMVIIFFVSSLAFFSVSILVSTIMVYTRDTYLVQNTFNFIMYCICGVVFPITYLPKFVQYISNLFPLTL